MSRDVRILSAEAIGTLVLVLGGPGTAILATGGFFGDGSVGVLGVALAFGLSLLVMAYAIGNISGCHINPAVTVAMATSGRIRLSSVPFYLVGQLLGAAAGGGLLWAITRDVDGFSPDDSNFAVNGWAQLSPGGFGFTAMAITEVVMTALLVFVVLSTAHRRFHPAAAGLTVGFALTLIHLISIPVDNTSVNPARSFSVAIYAGGDAIEQLWAFFLFPVIGALVGTLAWQLIDDSADDPAIGVDVAASEAGRAVVADGDHDDRDEQGGPGALEKS